MRNEHLFIFTFCSLAAIFFAGIFLFNSSNKQIVAVGDDLETIGDFLMPHSLLEEESEEVYDIRTAAESILLEINGEKHLGILSVDFFSFFEALDFCQSKGLKMPNGISLMTTNTDAHENGGNNTLISFFSRHKKNEDSGYGSMRQSEEGRFSLRTMSLYSCFGLTTGQFGTSH